MQLTVEIVIAFAVMLRVAGELFIAKVLNKLLWISWGKKKLIFQSHFTKMEILLLKNDTFQNEQLRCKMEILLFKNGDSTFQNGNFTDVFES